MSPAPPALPERLLVPDGEASAEITIKNSVFIGTIGTAADSDSARTMIAGVRERYADANHNAWAYVITGGPQAEIGSSDDGEPGGTAGRPMLAVLEGSGLVQAVAVGTRYFGGTKLGTGGLVRAYGDCVRAALKVLPVAELLYHRRARVEIDYALYGALKYTLPRLQVLVENEEYGATVILSLLIPPGSVAELSTILRDATAGRTRLEELLSDGVYVKVER